MKLLLHDESPAAVEEREKNFILGTYARTSFHPRSGKGARLTDAEGNEYWDLLGGIAVNVLGHQHPRLVKTLREESRSLLHVSNLFSHPAQGILGERLVRASGLLRAFFCNSGTEANEAALKFARLANPGKSEIVALEESFHGRTLGALSLTGHAAYRTPFEPLVPGAIFVAPNDIAALEASVSEKTNAIVLEPVMGEGGVIPLTPEYLAAARRLANRFGARFGNGLRKMQSRGPGIVDVRGRGMMWGIELDRPAKDVARGLMAKGFVVGTARDTVIRLLPPYITPKRAFVEFVETLEKELVVVGSQLPAPLPQLVAQGAISK